MPSERQLIQRIRKRARNLDPGLRVPIGDDAAVLDWPASVKLVLAKDVMVEDRHFRRGWAVPEFLAEKSLAVNLSDLAAMGAQPRGSLLGLTLPPRLGPDFATRFLDHFADFADRMHCPLLGGDLSGGSQIHISVTALGGLSGEPWRRGGGQAGDCLLLIGEAGWAAAGLAELERIGSLPHSLRTRKDLRSFCHRQQLPAALLEAHLLPSVYLDEAAWFAAHTEVHAAIDISDGLAGDLAQVAEESRLQVLLDRSVLQVFREPESRKLRLDNVLGGGEDYSLALTLSTRDWERVQECYPDTLSKPHRIGELVAGPPGIAIPRDDALDPLSSDRYDHFC